MDFTKCILVLIGLSLSPWSIASEKDFEVTCELGGGRSNLLVMVHVKNVSGKDLEIDDPGFFKGMLAFETKSSRTLFVTERNRSVIRAGATVMYPKIVFKRGAQFEVKLPEKDIVDVTGRLRLRDFLASLRDQSLTFFCIWDLETESPKYNWWDLERERRLRR
jgi:hypothetical protein